MSKDIKQARAEADAARARLNATVVELRHRLSPKVIARETAQGAANRLGHAVTTGNEAMRARPWLPWAIGIAVGGFAAWRTNRRAQSADKTTSPIRPLSAEPGD